MQSSTCSLIKCERGRNGDGGEGRLAAGGRVVRTSLRQFTCLRALIEKGNSEPPVAQ